MDPASLLAKFDALIEADDPTRERELQTLEREDPEAAVTLRKWLLADARGADERLTPGRFAPSSSPQSTHDSFGAGDRVGPFKLVRELGHGGMGSVWLAQREGDFEQHVALKLIRSDLGSADAEQRFRRERQILASLRHPHIAQLIDGGLTPEGRPWLAMEYVDGESLREVIARGSLPPERLVRVGAQVAAALAHAHAAGVVHRDLKPDNVMIAREGFVKVLDFGIAKILREEDAPQTTTSTRPGHVIGTTPYMSPEQASGDRVDFRSDQFAFGALLYEAATGTAAFARKTPSETVAAVLRDAPPEIDSLAGKVPSALLRVMRRCLQKDPSQRYGATSDLAHDLADLERGETTTAPRPRASAANSRIAWLALALVAASAGAWWFGRASAPPPSSTQKPHWSAEIPLAPAEKLSFGWFAMHGFGLSPDGRRLVFSAETEGNRVLYVRALDGRSALKLPGSEGGSNPVFSPDGEWIAFYANQKLKKIPVGGGTPTNLAEAPNALGGIDWPTQDEILYSPHPSGGINAVSSEGGEPRSVTEPDTKVGEASQVWPFQVRGTSILLYAAEIEEADSFDAARIYALDRTSGKRALLIDAGSDPRVVGDVLYYNRGGVIYSVGFDAARLALRGSPHPILSGVVYSRSTGVAQFVAANGVMVHAAGGAAAEQHDLVIVDREGRIEPLGNVPATIDRLRVSPDGKRAILQVTEADDDIWAFDFARRALTRVTDSGENLHPAWAPDGRHIIYSHHATPVPPPPRLFRRLADGSGEPELLLESDGAIRAQLYADASPDGNYVMFGQYTLEHNFDLYLLDLRTKTATVWLSTPRSDIVPRFSPDGRYVAYAQFTSLESTGEVYVQTFKGDSRRWQISNAGGSQPIWGRDGREIFFMRRGVLHVVELAAGDDLAPSAPRVVFTPTDEFASRFDVFPDGQHFLMLRKIPNPALSAPLRIDIDGLPKAE